MRLLLQQPIQQKRWRAKSANRVLDEIEYILNRFPNVKIIDPIDDNVFVDQQRVKEICQGILYRKINVHWRANCRFDYLSTYDKDFLGLFAQAGCVELDFGGESGSPRLQELICKDVTAAKCSSQLQTLSLGHPPSSPMCHG